MAAFAQGIEGYLEIFMSLHLLRGEFDFVVLELWEGVQHGDRIFSEVQHDDILQATDICDFLLLQRPIQRFQIGESRRWGNIKRCLMKTLAL